MDEQRGGPHDPEAGVALFYTLLVTLVVSGIVAVVFASALTEQRQSAFELDFEDTIHVAETGAEVYLSRLVEDPSLNSGVDGPKVTGEDPADWAIRVASDTSIATVDGGEGEAVALRPQGEDAEFIYGVGFVPNRDAVLNDIGENFVRVVRVQVAFSPSSFAGDHALLTGGSATLSGTYDIRGSGGSVHTNGAISNNGSGTVEGGISYSGTCLKGCDVATPAESQPIPPVPPEDVWGTRDAVAIAAVNDWYDYCAGSWKLRRSDDTAPCQGVIVSALDPNLQPWTGTSYNNPTLPSDAVYYFDGDVDVDIKQPSGKLTVITGGDITIGPTANGNPPDARYPGLFLLAGGDINIGGNAASGEFQTQNPALVFANGTVNLNGTIDTNQISFTARDGANVGTSYKGGGNGSVTYSGGAIADLGGDGFPIIIQWDEVR